MSLAFAEGDLKGAAIQAACKPSKQIAVGDYVSRKQDHLSGWWNSRCGHYNVSPKDSFEVVHVDGVDLRLAGLGDNLVDVRRFNIMPKLNVPAEDAPEATPSVGDCVTNKEGISSTWWNTWWNTLCGRYGVGPKDSFEVVELVGDNLLLAGLGNNLVNHTRFNIMPKPAEYTGGSVDYYQVSIVNPTTKGRPVYIAECNDIIEHLGMNFAEGNAFKALWRRAAARSLGLTKAGAKADGLYDAEKVVFFGERLVEQSKTK
ncbi:hypothetical protein [Pectobacterium phage Jarilo]|uniref:Uncharacterized protein n=1 Tax=Pectobacterium phage Jarilo TaxID=2163634 RepID=A0A2S1GSY4_9CAUD|nr:hypothetical protein HOT17_gp12 [Pectobacterium phage Jarilo]AWD92493.1 hypothetical protein [Pectobacterium phage Jarilo]